MTYEDIRDILGQQRPEEVLELCGLEEADELVFALTDHIESHQDEIKEKLEENRLI